MISEELQEIISVVSEAGFEHLVGDILTYAVRQPNSYFEGDANSEEIREPESQIQRAVEFLRFQTSIAEMHLNDAENFAQNLQGGSDTSIVFLPSFKDDGDLDGEPAVYFREGLREKWGKDLRVTTIGNLEAILKDIERNGSQ